MGGAVGGVVGGLVGGLVGGRVGGGLVGAAATKLHDNACPHTPASSQKAQWAKFIETPPYASWHLSIQSPDAGFKKFELKQRPTKKVLQTGWTQTGEYIPLFEPCAWLFQCTVLSPSALSELRAPFWMLQPDGMLPQPPSCSVLPGTAPSSSAAPAASQSSRPTGCTASQAVLPLKPS